LRELSIGFVPFSPLGRGFLSGKIRSTKELDKNDFRQKLERFNEQNLPHNYQLVEFLQKMAEKNNSTAVQIALAWLLRQGDDIVPIPGTKHVKYLEENLHAVDLVLPENDWTALSEFLQAFKLTGARYPESVAKLVDRSE